ncbi:MAG: molybdate ABC transporter substrate-binding protein [Pelosinus sp.]|nr:molybdate ABC transporter substrate-binding protein [Pelosinus sp.]
MNLAKRLAALMLSAVCLVTLVAGCGTNTKEKVNSPEEKKTEIFVSAAASLTDVMNELTQLYNKTNPNVKITYSFGSSGALQSQIEEGAPADIFMSAAQKQMNELDKKDLIVKESRKDLLVNKVVLITAKENAAGLKDFKDVTSPKINLIALGEPKAVPVGQYSEEIFNSLGILDAVKAKVIYGSDVRQVLTWVEAGEAACGVVYATDAATTAKVKVIAEAPAGSHKPVIYPVAIVKSSKNVKAAQGFVDFLATKEAAAVFEKYGFKMN